MLGELARIGLNMARLLERQAEAEAAAVEADDAPPRATGPDLHLKFNRVARAVRLTLALQARLEAEGLEQARKAQAHDLAERRRLGRARKAEVRRAAELAIATDSPEHEKERLFEALDERLDDYEADDACFAERPVGEQVALICRYLGVTLDWSLFEDEDWAMAEAASAAQDPRAPFPPPHPGEDASEPELRAFPRRASG